ncbi:hypothetical protein ACIBTV_17440 [Micromonospora sp. NPDC049366]|uniref:hypothetical protein n=1 Tax=Micromonospora sp. NPDC049366 TaxID=3364271 RepID=UPI0037881AF8
MNDDRLRLDLAGLADEVTPVDLRDRALRTSRRLGIQRVVATSAAALVLVGVAAGTAFAIRPDATAPSIPGDSPRPADSPSANVNPPGLSTPSMSPPVAPNTSSTVTTDPSAATIGRVVYGTAADSPGDERHGFVHSWRPGGKVERSTELPREATRLNMVVAPNGRTLAWVSGGALYTSDVDGSGKRKIRDGVDPACWNPAWSPDSRELTIAVVTAAEPAITQVGVLDVGSNEFTELPGTEGCHPVWSASGEFFAYADGSTGKVLLARFDGPVRRAVPGLGGEAAPGSLDLASLSPDGGRIALLRRGADEPGGDVARDLRVNVVLDTRTGEEVQLPLGGRELWQAYFQADGTLVARVKSGDGFALVLVDATGRKISEVVEPAELNDEQIIGVAA